MANHKPHMVVIDRDFVREEAAEAVRTFFRPVVGAYNFVRRTSDPDGSRYSASKPAARKAKDPR